MALIDKYELGADATWRARCQMAALQAATDVMAEAVSTPGHDLRADFANKVLLQPALQSGAIAFGVAAQPGIVDETASDSDILFTVNSLWNAWSGYSAVA